MSRIVSSGPNGANPLAPESGPERRQGAGRDTRFDDRPKGMGGREAGLRARTGSDHEGTFLAMGEDPRAEKFGQRLDGALGRDGKGEGESEREGRRDEGARDPEARDHAAAEAAGEMAASLFAAAAVPSPSGRTPARSTRDDTASASTAPQRRGALTNLWTQDADAASQDAPARTRPAAGTGGVAGMGAATDMALDAGDGQPAAGAAHRAVRLLAESGPRDGAASRSRAEAARETDASRPIDPSVQVAAAVPQPAQGFGAQDFGAQGSGVPAGSTADAGSGPATAERVGRIADRVEQAIGAEDRLAAGQPVTLSIPLARGGDGLARLDVAMTPDGLDVTLVRGVDGQASADLVQAAQTLVERLQRRFPKSHVRVRDAVEAGEGSRGADAHVAGRVRPADGARQAS